MTRVHINELFAKNALKAEEITISLDSKSEIHDLSTKIWWCAHISDPRSNGHTPTLQYPGENNQTRNREARYRLSNKTCIALFSFALTHRQK